MFRVAALIASVFRKRAAGLAMGIARALAKASGASGASSCTAGEAGLTHATDVAMEKNCPGPFVRIRFRWGGETSALAS